MKAVILGTSGIGRRHARNIIALQPDAQLFAVRNEHNEATKELGMTLVADIEAAVKLHPNMAVIALPPSLHGNAANTFLEAGIPIYLEKPVAMYVEEIQVAVEAAEIAGITTMVGCHLRMMPGFVKLKHLISEGAIGPVHVAHLSVGQWLPDWRPGRDYRNTYSAHRAQGGGVLLDLVHELDMARNLFGEFTSITARAGTSGALEIETEDHADVILERDGLSVNVHLDYLDKASHRTGRIIGGNGTLTYDVLNGSMSQYDPENKTWDDLYVEGDFDSGDTLKRAMAHFIDCVERGVPTDQPLMEGVRSLMLSESARRSAGLLS